MGVVKAVCLSEKKGTEKHPIEYGEFEVGFGLKGDAHGGNWHRQVSLLSYDKVKEFNEKGANVKHGDFGENIVVEGFDFRNLPVGSRFYCNDVILEMTQIGKECHTHCTIYHRVGDCIMPREGVFAKVIRGGIIRPGDEMTWEVPALDRKLQAAVITMSDKASKGEREDVSGPLICGLLEEEGYEVAETLILPDEPERLSKQLIRLADQRQLDVIITSGGTGLSKRDWTPEATMKVADRNIPGIAEALRMESMKYTTRAMLSRGVAVIRKDTIIVNLPGSPKAAKECMGVLLSELGHAIRILKGLEIECGNQKK